MEFSAPSIPSAPTTTTVAPGKAAPKASSPLPAGYSFGEEAPAKKRISVTEKRAAQKAEADAKKEAAAAKKAEKAAADEAAKAAAEEAKAAAAAAKAEKV